jgi:hypothetical protein
MWLFNADVSTESSETELSILSTAEVIEKLKRQPDGTNAMLHVTSWTGSSASVKTLSQSRRISSGE